MQYFCNVLCYFEDYDIKERMRHMCKPLFLIPILPVIVVCAIYIAIYWVVRARKRYGENGSIWSI